MIKISMFPSSKIAFILSLSLFLATASSANRNGGVILYEDAGFRGKSVQISGDVDNLRGLPVGNDRASSIRVDRGCVAYLFGDENFRGQRVEVRGDVQDLGRTALGNDRLSSIEVRCGAAGWSEGRDEGYDADRYRDDRNGGDRYGDDRYGDDRYGDDRYGGDRYGDRNRDDRYRDEYRDWRGSRGVVLYEDTGFRGRSELFEYDDEFLGDNVIGNDRVSSIRVAPGCQVTVYEHSRYSGISSTFEYDEPDLRDSRVGNDRVSSIAVRCRRDGRRPLDWGSGVVIYSDSDFSGRSETFTRSERSLKRTAIGNDQASSIQVARGCTAVLYSDKDYRGLSIRVDRDIDRLGDTRLGNDRLSSIEVRCSGRRR